MAFFFTRNFVLLWQGQLVSQLGNQAFLIATAYFTLDATGSAMLVAAVMMASTVPIALLGPVGGTVADRHSRRGILVLTDLARSISVGGLGLYVLSLPDPSAQHVMPVIAVAVFGGVMGALFSPAVQALIPDLVPRDRLAAANAVNQMSIQGSVLIGQAMGGLLYVRYGAAWLLLFDAASFAYAAAATWLIPADSRCQPARAGIGGTLTQYAAQMREGFAYVRGRRGMVAVLVTFAGVNFLFMPVFVLLPFYVRDSLGAGPAWYGFLLAGAGAGALAGAAMAGALLPSVRSRGRLIRTCATGVGLLVLLLAATSAPWLALGAFAGIGVLSSVINITVITTFQSALPSDVRGRVMALVIALSTAAAPVGMAMGGVMGHLWRDSLHAVFAGCGAAIVILIAMTLRNRGFAELLDVTSRDRRPPVV